MITAGITIFNTFQWQSQCWSSAAGSAGTPPCSRTSPGRPLLQWSPGQQRWSKEEGKTWMIPRYCKASMRGILLLPGAFNCHLTQDGVMVIWCIVRWPPARESWATWWRWPSWPGSAGEQPEEGKLRKDWIASEERMFRWNLEGWFPLWLSPPSRSASPPSGSHSSCSRWRSTAPAGNPINIASYMYQIYLDINQKVPGRGQLQSGWGRHQDGQWSGRINSMLCIYTFLKRKSLRSLIFSHKKSAEKVH